MEQGTLKPEGYIPRIYDRLLSDKLDIFDAVEVSGTMWCGKTWTSLSFGQSVTHVDQPETRQTIEADPTTALMGDSPHIIDEWQDVPAIWDAVRSAVDAAPEPQGRYILTGSSSLDKKLLGHSGAGRITTLRMRTMSLAEMDASTAAVSLAGLFDGQFEPCLVQQKLPPLAELICRGGWPALYNRDSTVAAEYIDSYFDALFSTNIPKRGLDSSEARRVARSVARNVGSAVKLETIGADALSDGLSRQAIRSRASQHLSALESLYVIEGVPGWDAPIRAKSRLRVKPKYYFADPSLAANLLQADPIRLLEDGQLFGLLFESLCMHDLAVYASALPQAPAQPLCYYRDSDGLEVDAIIELRDGRWGAFEIKLGEDKVDEAAASLSRLRKKVANNVAARNPQPAFMAVLVGAGEFARYDQQNDVYVIPITALGA